MSEGIVAVGGIPRPPDGIGQRRAAAAPGAGTTPHFFAGPGPMDVVKLAAPATVRLRGGGRAEVAYELPWVLERVVGTTRREALRRIEDVLRDPRGWVRAGVRWRRVADPAVAVLRVSVVPADATRCGKQAVGCYSWGDGEAPLAEVGVDLIGRDGPWRNVVGMEACGHALRMDDMYLPVHQPYAGSMGTWEEAAAFGFYPSDAEIAAAKQWLAGETPAALVHEH